PDHLRTDKRLFKKIATAISPKIAYAKSTATADRNNVLSSRNIVELLKENLSSDITKEIFSEKLATYVLSRIKIQNEVKSKASFKTLLKRYTPRWVKRRVLNMPVKTELNFNLLALRMYIATQMQILLTADAHCLKTGHNLKDEC